MAQLWLNAIAHVSSTCSSVRGTSHHHRNVRRGDRRTSLAAAFCTPAGSLFLAGRFLAMRGKHQSPPKLVRVSDKRRLCMKGTAVNTR